MKDIQTGVELNEDGRCVLGSETPKAKPRYRVKPAWARGDIGVVYVIEKRTLCFWFAFSFGMSKQKAQECCEELNKEDA